MSKSFPPRHDCRSTYTSEIPDNDAWNQTGLNTLTCRKLILQAGWIDFIRNYATAELQSLGLFPIEIAVLRSLFLDTPQPHHHAPKITRTRHHLWRLIFLRATNLPRWHLEPAGRIAGCDSHMNRNYSAQQLVTVTSHGNNCLWLGIIRNYSSQSAPSPAAMGRCSEPKALRRRLVGLSWKFGIFKTCSM